MLTLYRYNCTLKQHGCQPVTISIVAKSPQQAREKAHRNLSHGTPFQTWKPSDIKVSKLESVDPACVFA